MQASLLERKPWRCNSPNPILSGAHKPKITKIKVEGLAHAFPQVSDKEIKLKWKAASDEPRR